MMSVLIYLFSAIEGLSKTPKKNKKTEKKPKKVCKVRYSFMVTNSIHLLHTNIIMRTKKKLC